jgi:hypothetical protein
MNAVGILMPSAFTGATIELEGSIDGTNFYDIYNTDGSALSITVGTDRLIALVPSDLACVRYLRIVSASSEAAERTINIIVRPLT